MINAQLMQMVINASNDGIVIAEKEGEDNILILSLIHISEPTRPY